MELSTGTGAPALSFFPAVPYGRLGSRAEVRQTQGALRLWYFPEPVWKRARDEEKAGECPPRLKKNAAGFHAWLRSRLGGVNFSYYK